MANISIKEGGIAKQFGHVNKLKISNQGGGTSLWVPEDAVTTKNLYVTKNGMYYASKDKDKPYGYDEVDVNITNEVYGYDDEDGGFYDIGVDDDGFLEEPEEVPDHIEITTPPTKTRYMAFEPINTAGMVVVAYYADGTEYGEIPREEYTIDPLVAQIGSDASIDEYTPKSESWGELKYPDECIPWHCTTAYSISESGERVDGQGSCNYRLTLHGTTYVGGFNGNAHPYLFFVSEQPIEYWKENYDAGPYSMDYSMTVDGKTYYARWLNHYARGEQLQSLFLSAPMNSNMDHGQTNNDNAKDLMRIIYGNKEGEPTFKETITVIWSPEDTAVMLTDTFKIEVEEIPIPLV